MTTTVRLAYGHSYTPPLGIPEITVMHGPAERVLGVHVFPPVLVPGSQATLWAWAAQVAR